MELILPFWKHAQSDVHNTCDYTTLRRRPRATKGPPCFATPRKLNFMGLLGCRVQGFDCGVWPCTPKPELESPYTQNLMAFGLSV